MEDDTKAALLLNSEGLRSALARNVTSARIALEMTQQQLADRANVSRSAVVLLEAAEGDPRLSTIANIAQALGLSAAFLLFGLDDIKAVDKAHGSEQAEQIRETLTEAQIEQMERLRSSGVNKNLGKAANLGAAAAVGLGLVSETTGQAAIAGAAIGSAILPGVGTILGGSIAAIWAARTLAAAVSDSKKDEV